MRRSGVWIPASIALTAAAVACYSATAVTTAPSGISTIVAGTIEAITASAPVPISPTMPTPTVTPSPIAPTAAPTRVNFINGATTGVLTGSIVANQSLAFVLRADQGQPMLVQVTSPENDVTTSIETQGGTSLLSPAAQQSTWRGTLPQSEDYVVTVHGGKAAQAFVLTIELVSRIKFAPGADTTKISGVTAGGYSVAYAVFVQQDQKFEVQLYGLGKNAALKVWGYANGKTYLGADSHKTSFGFTAPSMQDYILEISPDPGKVLDFVIYVRIK